MNRDYDFSQGIGNTLELLENILRYEKEHGVYPDGLEYGDIHKIAITFGSIDDDIKAKALWEGNDTHGYESFISKM